MRYRVDELAARGGVTVDTVRFYQARGLLPPPEREGRVAWYTEDHLERLRRILDLKAKGFTLAVVSRAVRGPIKTSHQADEVPEQLVEAFRLLLPATTSLVAHHFRRVLLAAAEARMARVGEEDELRAVKRESERRLEPSWRG